MTRCQPPTNPHNTRLRAQRDERIPQAWALRVEGKTLREIGDELGCSPETARKYIIEAKEKLHDELIDNARVEAAAQVAKYDHIYSEAMKAWERSKGPAKRVTRTLDGDGKTKGDQTAVVEEQVGDPRYLEKAMQALGAVRDILGINAPVKLDVSVARLPSPEELDDRRAQIGRLARFLAERGFDPARRVDAGPEIVADGSVGGVLPAPPPRLAQ